jgi:antagonist of KipI
MTLLGGTFAFPDGATIALVGSKFGATLDEARIEMHSSIEVKSGQVLRVGSTCSGARCYLCIQGGFHVESFLGSSSTHLLSGLGGYEGRALRKGDVLAVGPAPFSHRKRMLAPGVLRRLAPRKTLRVTAGPQSDWFPESTRQSLYASTYRVTEESNRMGIRLEGPPLVAEHSSDMITEGVSLGTIQVPVGGLPIILFVEQQTTGGYPKIANVISADFPSLGQLRPRDEIRFELVSFEEARRLLVEQETFLSSKGLILE